MDKWGYLPYDGGKIKCYLNQVKSFEPNLSNEIEGVYAYAEQHLIDLMISDFTPETTFIDIGANIGMFSMIAAKRCKKVYAFEANPEIFGMLKDNLTPFDNCEIFNVALTDEGGHATLYLHKQRGGADTIIEQRMNAPNLDKTITVSCAKLDGYGLKADIGYTHRYIESWSKGTHVACAVGNALDRVKVIYGFIETQGFLYKEAG